MFDVRPEPVAKLAEQTVLCVGDLMLDDFVYGEVARISPEAPAPVIAVKRSEMVDRRRRQRRAQYRRARRALHLRRRGRRDDDAGRTLKAALAGRAARSRRISWSTGSRPTTRKVRFVSEHHSHPSAARRLGAGAAGRCRDREGADRSRARGVAARATPWCCRTTPRAC